MLLLLSGNLPTQKKCVFLIVNLTSKMTSECFCVASRPAGHAEEVRLHSRLLAVFVFLTLISGYVLVLQFTVNYFTLTLTHLPQKFCRKTHFEASQVVFWSLWCYKELKLTIKPFTGRKRHGLLIQLQNISFQSSGMGKKKNFKIVFWF